MHVSQIQRTYLCIADRMMWVIKRELWSSTWPRSWPITVCWTQRESLRSSDVSDLSSSQPSPTCCQCSNLSLHGLVLIHLSQQWPPWLQRLLLWIGIVSSAVKSSTARLDSDELVSRVHTPKLTIYTSGVDSFFHVWRQTSFPRVTPWTQHPMARFCEIIKV